MGSRLGQHLRTFLGNRGWRRRADLDAAGIRLGSARSSLHRNQLSWYGRLLEGGAGPRSILDATAEPVTALAVWQEAFPRAAARGVYATEPDSPEDPAGHDIVRPERWDADFWADIAEDLDPDLIVGDAALGAERQLEMFQVLFPVLCPGGLFILEDFPAEPAAPEGPAAPAEPASPAGTAATVPSAARDYLASLAAGQPRSGPGTPQGEFWDYCRRNVAAVELGNGSIAVRKRQYDQRKLLAVPFAQLAHDHRVLDEPGAYPRIRPEILGSEPMAKRVDAMLARHAGAVPPRAEIGRIKDALIIGEGIVLVAGKYIVEESFINQRHTARRDILFRVGQSDLYVTEQPVKRPRRMPPGPDYVGALQTWDSNYGHWIVDTLPRVVNALALADPRTAKIILNGRRTKPMKAVFTESLGLLGITPGQLDWKEDSPLAFTDLVYATPMTVPPLIKSDRCLDILESLAQGTGDDPEEQPDGRADRIYLSRNRYSRRRLLNEQDLLPLLRAKGYAVIYPEELTLVEQMTVFRKATHVVGNMGAAMSNLCFSPQGVSVLALATEQMMHDYFYDLVCHKHGRYMSLQGSSPDKSAGIGADFTIDLGQFERALNDFDEHGSPAHA